MSAPTAQPSTARGPRTLSDPETWLEQHGDVLYRYALPRLRDAHLAEEVVQEALLAALQARERFSGQSSERTWLIGILKHKIIDHFRRTKRELVVENLEVWPEDLKAPFDEAGHWRIHDGEGPVDWGEDAAGALQQKEFHTILADCLSKLPPRIAEAFTLREMEELSTEEICKTLNITATNFWVMLHRARVQLRQCLELKWFGKGKP